MNKKNQQSITENEVILDTHTLGNDLEKAKNKIHSGIGKKLNKDRDGKLYHGTFAEHVKKETGLHPKYGHNIAKVARFSELTPKFSEELSSMSLNSQDQFVINHNKRLKRQRKENYSNKFTPLLEQIIGITIESKNDKVKMTPKIINVCDKVITDFLNAENLEYDDSHTEKVTKKLKENYDSLVLICKEKLKTTAISKIPKTCQHLHEVISIKKNLLTLKCGCVFRLI